MAAKESGTAGQGNKSDRISIFWDFLLILLGLARGLQTGRKDTGCVLLCGSACQKKYAVGLVVKQAQSGS